MAFRHEVVTMAKNGLLLKTFLRRQRGSVAALTLLFFLISLSLFTSLTLLHSGEISVSNEMDRLGFGTITVWVNGGMDALADEISALPEVESVTSQPLIFSGYRIDGKYSDDEGQLIVYDGEAPYRFLDERGKRIEVTEVAEGVVYLSPAMRSSYHVAVGDTVDFELSRADGMRSLTVAGYFEDAFMGSSMIDMKSFLISPTTRRRSFPALRSLPTTAPPSSVTCCFYKTSSQASCSPSPCY